MRVFRKQKIRLLGLLSQLPYPGSCLPYPFTCAPRAVVVHRKDRKERVDTDGRRHTHCKPPPGVPGGATAPARAVAHNSGTCLPRPPGSMPGCPGDTMPTAASSDTSSGGQPCTFGPPRRVARDRSPNTRSLVRSRRIRPLYTSLVYCLVAYVLCIRLSYTFFLHSIRHTLYLTAYFQISSHMSFASHRIRPLYTLYALSDHFEMLSHTSFVYLSRILPLRIRPLSTAFVYVF